MDLSGVPRKVEVTWKDCETGDGWTDLNDVLNKPLTEMLACGYLVRDDTEAIALAIGHDTTKVNCIMWIPRGAVISMKDLN